MNYFFVGCRTPGHSDSSTAGLSPRKKLRDTSSHSLSPRKKASNTTSPASSPAVSPRKNTSSSSTKKKKNVYLNRIPSIKRLAANLDPSFNKKPRLDKSPTKANKKKAVEEALSDISDTELNLESQLSLDNVSDITKSPSLDDVSVASGKANLEELEEISNLTDINNVPALDEPHETISTKDPIRIEHKDVSDETEIQDIDGGITEDIERDNKNDGVIVTASVDADAPLEKINAIKVKEGDADNDKLANIEKCHSNTPDTVSLTYKTIESDNIFETTIEMKKDESNASYKTVNSNQVLVPQAQKSSKILERQSIKSSRERLVTNLLTTPIEAKKKHLSGKENIVSRGNEDCDLISKIINSSTVLKTQNTDTSNSSERKSRDRRKSSQKYSKDRENEDLEGSKDTANGGKESKNNDFSDCLDDVEVIDLGEDSLERLQDIPGMIIFTIYSLIFTVYC